MRLHTTVLAALVATGLATSVSAGKLSIADNTLAVPSSINGNRVEVKVSGPEQFNYKSASFSGDAIVSAGDMGFSQDGLYKFEVLEIKELGEEVVVDDFNGRGQAVRKRVEAIRTSGTFRVKNGMMVDSSLIEVDKKALGIDK